MQATTMADIDGPTADIDGVTVPTGHLIGGKWVGSAETFESRSPIDWDGRVLANVARGDAATADAAVAAATEGFATWSAFSRGERAQYLRRLADQIESKVDEIATVEAWDMGFMHRSMRERLVARGALNFRTYADLIDAYEPEVWEARNTLHRVDLMPAGPAVVITPWNAPFMLATWKLAPALAAGNSIILKPAEWSPLSAALLAQCTIDAGFPPGVFNLTQGFGSEVGDALVHHRGVRRISFTGSPPTGRHIAAAAAQNLVPFTGELGGKGALIVCADADLDAAVKQAAAQFEDSGQVCLAGTRLLV